MDPSAESSEDIVLQIIGEELDVPRERLALTTSLIEDLNADSLALINIVMKVEERFKIDVPDDDWRGLRTVGDVIAYVRTMASSSAAGSEIR